MMWDGQSWLPKGGAGLRGTCRIKPARAKDSSPGREPWEVRARSRAPWAKERSFAQGAFLNTSVSHGSRRGLLSFAPGGAWTSAHSKFRKFLLSLPVPVRPRSGARRAALGRSAGQAQARPTSVLKENHA